MVWGVIGALDEEVALLCQRMEVKKTTENYGSIYYSGTLEGQEVVVCCCNVGKINAALCASVMVREMKADVVINVGIAGALDKRLKVLDVVLSENVTHHDCDPVLKKFNPFTLDYNGDAKLLKLAQEACAAVAKDYSFYTGKIATGDVFVNGGPVRDSIVSRFEPMCVEMEGAAIAQACYMNNTPFLIIRTMSDTADDEADMTYDTFKDKAALQSKEILLEMLRRAE